ncbi:MAG: extracellular solute-binding protein [Ruminococcus sp.]|nr:extracellular solute-binding protein [Ruminococcus sp.]MCM1382672.1 extracellular solute-binding protein [Muribaculaceae bacterium]MCM1480454.1 extracellular solute-binding protein [Muribaculaceae bacterium]
MKNFKKIIAAAVALSSVMSLAACGDGGSDSTPETTTTTAITVAINSETLAAEEQQQVADAASLLPDVELENKNIKWFSFYDPFHPTTSGNTKSISLELFEEKYDGTIEYIPTEWGKRFDDLSINIMGGTGIDFIAGGDLDSFPRGVPIGQFETYDEYVDFDSELWSTVKKANDMFVINGGHYLMITQVTGGSIVVYNRQTIENYGFDDPAELFANGEWTWSAFKNMLTEFVDNDEGRYGLDGWFNEKPLMLSGGVPPLELRDGKLVSNLYDERLEKAMNFMYDLNKNGLVLDKNIMGWNVHPEFIGQGTEIFYIDGTHVLESAPEIWTETYGAAEDVMFVPIPKMDDSDTYYINAGMEAFMLCKGAQNPEGVARFMECCIAAALDENAAAIADRKSKEDYGWSDEMIEMKHTIAQMAKENPVYSIHTGVGSELSSMLDSGDQGIRAPFYGTEWATVRESLADATDTYIEEFNASLEAAG